MNWIDAAIIIILAVSVVSGFINGFVKELASLTALILGIWGAIKFSAFTAARLYDYFDMTGKYVGLVAFIITFGIIVVIIHFIGILADNLIKALALGFLNRLLGIVFSFFKSILILSILFVVINVLNSEKHFISEEKIEESYFYNPISDIAPALFPIIGEGPFERSFERFRKKPQDPII
jgi:membrane protein required for colicin V production